MLLNLQYNTSDENILRDISWLNPLLCGFLALCIHACAILAEMLVLCLS